MNYEDWITMSMILKLENEWAIGHFAHIVISNTALVDGNSRRYPNANESKSFNLGM